jgi:hypothetical protein
MKARRQCQNYRALSRKRSTTKASDDSGSVAAEAKSPAVKPRARKASTTARRAAVKDEEEDDEGDGVHDAQQHGARCSVAPPRHTRSLISVGTAVEKERAAKAAKTTSAPTVTATPAAPAPAARPRDAQGANASLATAGAAGAGERRLSGVADDSRSCNVCAAGSSSLLPTSVKMEALQRNGSNGRHKRAAPEADDAGERAGTDRDHAPVKSDLDMIAALLVDLKKPGSDQQGSATGQQS